MRPFRPAHRAAPPGVGGGAGQRPGLLRQGLDGGCESLLGQRHRVDAVCELAELGEQQSQLLLRARKLRIVAVLGDREADRQRQRHKPLLGSVVKVALQSSAFDVAGLDDSSARRAQLLQLRPQLGVQALILKREANGGRNLVGESGSANRPGLCAITARSTSSRDERRELLVPARCSRRPAMSTSRPSGRRWSSSRRDLRASVTAPCRAPPGQASAPTRRQAQPARNVCAWRAPTPMSHPPPADTGQPPARSTAARRRR